VSDCMHTAYNITQLFQTFRFEKTRCDRTAVSAPTYDRHGHISTKSSEVPKQVRQRNIHRTVQMIVTHSWADRTSKIVERWELFREARTSRAPICVICSVSSR
jgi:hypothetical protein